MEWKHGNTVLVRWLYWKFFWYTASNAQSTEETLSQLALLSLGNRSQEHAAYVGSVHEGTNQKQKTFATYFWQSDSQTPRETCVSTASQ